MPTQATKQSADILVQVENLLARFEAVRSINNVQDKTQLQEIQKLAAQIDAQFKNINAALEIINRAQRLFAHGESGLGGTPFASSAQSAQSSAPRRSQDEWAHLLSRLVLGGFDNL